MGQVNDQYIKVAKIQGEFPWHQHDQEDEMFFVLRGHLRIGRSDADGGPVSVLPGEFFVVPRGVRHNTSATEETWIALIETVSTLHTGTEQTRSPAPSPNNSLPIAKSLRSNIAPQSVT